MRNEIPYILLSAVYGVINTYLPIVLAIRQFSKGEIGILLAIIEVTGLTIPFFITAKLDKNGRYGFTMILLGFSMGLAIGALLWFRSFWVTALCLGIFAIGSKGLVPILDSFTARILRNNPKKYGVIRAFGSAGFVCMTIFLQFFPPIQGNDVSRFIVMATMLSCAFAVSVLRLPSIFNTTVLKATSPHPTETAADEKALLLSKPFVTLLLVIFLAWLGMVPSQRFFSLYVEEYIHSHATAALWALAASAEIPLMIFSGRLIWRFGTEKLLFVCLISISIRHISYIILPGISGAVFGQLLHSICFGLFFPLSIITCTGHSNGKTATAMMLLTAANGLANIVGSVIGGYIIEYFGYPALFLSFSLWPLVGIGIYTYQNKRYHILADDRSVQ
ncbi:MAG: MFS transporter [Treponema sp.]